MVYYKLTKKKHINLRDAWNHMNLAMVALTNFGFKEKNSIYYDAKKRLPCFVLVFKII